MRRVWLLLFIVLLVGCTKEPSETPEQAIVRIEFEIQDRNLKSFVDDAYYSNDFRRKIEGTQDISLDEFKQLVKAMSLEQIPLNRIDDIDITKKKQIRKDYVELDYTIYYLGYNGVKIPSKSEKVFLIYKDDMWRIDVEPLYDDFFEQFSETQILKDLIAQREESSQ